MITRRGVSGVTSQSALAAHELAFPEPAAQAPTEAELFRRLGEAGVNSYLVSHTATTLAFVTAAGARPGTRMTAASITPGTLTPESGLPKT